MDVPFVYEIEAVRTRRRTPERFMACGSVQTEMRVAPPAAMRTIPLPFGQAVDGLVLDGRLHVRDEAPVAIDGGSRSFFGVEAVRMFEDLAAGGDHPARSTRHLQTLARLHGSKAYDKVCGRNGTDDLREVVRDGRHEAEAAALETAAGHVLCGGTLLTSFREPVFHPVPNEGPKRFAAVVEDVRDPLGAFRFRPRTVSVAAAAELDPDGPDLDPDLVGAAFRHDPMSRSILFFLEAVDSYGRLAATGLSGAAMARLREASLAPLSGGSIPEDRWEELTDDMDHVARILETVAGSGPDDAEARKAMRQLPLARNAVVFRRESAPAETAACLRRAARSLPPPCARR